VTRLGSDAELLAIGLATGLATLAGGAAALRLRSALGLLLGFGAGAVTGVAFFDLLPEALTISPGAPSAGAVMTAAAAGFGGYLVFDRLVLRFQPAGNGRGHVRAGLLVAHSLMDGLGIGLAFKVSGAAGLIVAVGVLAHDLLDGANTVALSVSGGAGGRAARRWLALDAAAPVIGLALSTGIRVSGPVLALLLAVFAGMFVNIGAGELLPDSHMRRPQLSTTAATLLGMALIYAAMRLAA